MNFTVVDRGKSSGSIDCVKEALRDFASGGFIPDRIGIVPFKRHERYEPDKQHYPDSDQYELRI